MVATNCSGQPFAVEGFTLTSTRVRCLALAVCVQTRGECLGFTVRSIAGSGPILKGRQPPEILLGEGLRASAAHSPLPPLL